MKKFFLQSLFLTALLVLGATGAFADTFTLWDGTPEAEKVEGQTNQYSIDLSGKFANYETITALTFGYTGSNARANSFNDASWIVGSEIKIVADEQDLITTGEKDILVAATTHEITITTEQAETLKSATNVTVVFKNLTLGNIELTGTEKQEVEQLIPDGKYYLVAMELEDNNIMAAGMNWGTQGIVNGQGLDLLFTFNKEQNAYTIDTNIYNGSSHFLNSELFMDQPSFLWSVEEDAVYGHCIYAMIDGVKKYISVATDGRLALSETAYAWGFFGAEYWESTKKEEGLDAMKAATADNGVNATFLIKDANFNRGDHRWEAWTVSDDCTNKNLGGGCDSGNGNGCAESYHSTFTISQVVADAPKGVYSMTAQGFYRQDDGATEELPVFFANDATANVSLLTGSENSMTKASYSFSEGKYAIEEPIFVEVAEGGTLTVGVKGTAAHQWVIWDNFQLTYYGPDATIDEVKNKEIVKQLADLRTKAGELKEQVDVEAVKTAIDNALTETESVSGAEAINKAIETMKAVIDKAEASIAAKDVLPKMKQLTETTNVYTQEAYDAYYTQWEAKYKDGTLTKAEASANIQDPFLVTGWRANIAVDNFLLSAWDTNPDFVDAPYYINSWSTEGESDGSDFKVPFIEYWVADAESLGEKTLTATMTGLEAGNYDVKALVRVRMKNGASAPTYGITMQANDGEAVDVAAGDQIGSSQLYLKEFTATGTVAEDGTLKIKFIVAADNNISWLAFKNVNYAKVGDTPEPQPEYSTLWTPETSTPQPVDGSDAYKIDLPIENFKNFVKAGDILNVSFDVNAEEIITSRMRDVKTGSVKLMVGETVLGEEVTGIEKGVKTQAFVFTEEMVAAVNATEATALTVVFTNLDMNKIDLTEKQGKPTGINQVKASLAGTTIYNLNGQKVMNAQKGLYIVNGKKVVVK